MKLENHRKNSIGATQTMYANPEEVKFSVEQLKVTGTSLRKDIDPSRKEEYLTDDDFLAEFGMSRVAFQKLAKWKQKTKKKVTGFH